MCKLKDSKDIHHWQLLDIVNTLKVTINMIIIIINRLAN
jgi:hypothetical protein